MVNANAMDKTDRRRRASNVNNYKASAIAYRPVSDSDLTIAV